MSTRGYICIENQEGKVKGIYCHHDTYPSYVGLVLYTYYNTNEKVQHLISLGGLSSLGIRIGEKFDSRKLYSMYGTPEYEKIKLQCDSYYRDRGEKLEILNWKTRSACFSNIRFDIDYIYLFKDGKWYVKDTKSTRMRPVFSVLQKDWVEPSKKRDSINFTLNTTYMTKAEQDALYAVFNKLGILDAYKRELEELKKKKVFN